MTFAGRAPTWTACRASATSRALPPASRALRAHRAAGAGAARARRGGGHGAAVREPTPGGDLPRATTGTSTRAGRRCDPHGRGGPRPARRQRPVRRPRPRRPSAPPPASRCARSAAAGPSSCCWSPACPPCRRGSTGSSSRTSTDVASLQVLAANPAIRTLFGSPWRWTTPGGFTVWRTGTFAALLTGLWTLLTAVRLTRGEEDAGRWALLLAGRLRMPAVVRRAGGGGRRPRPAHRSRARGGDGARRGRRRRVAPVRGVRGGLRGAGRGGGGGAGPGVPQPAGRGGRRRRRGGGVPADADARRRGRRTVLAGVGLPLRPARPGAALRRRPDGAAGGARRRRAGGLRGCGRRRRPPGPRRRSAGGAPREGRPHPPAPVAARLRGAPGTARRSPAGRWASGRTSCSSARSPSR